MKMKIRKTILSIGSLSALALPLIATLLFESGCGKATSTIDVQSYTKEIDQWKQKRLTRLTSEDGWLTLCGIFWLKEGENPLGSDSTNTIVLPSGKAPKIAGSIVLEKGTVRLRAKPDAGIKYKDSVVTTMALQSDEMTDPTILTLGTLSFYVIKRGDQLAVRVKDTENPARLNFKGLDYFPIDTKWRIEAKFEPYNPPKILEIVSKVGTTEKDSCPGALAFEVDGKSYRIDAVIEKGSENQFFIMVGDETNSKETYANGRQLYTDLPDANNTVILDFNKAYNWPCVFTDFATCPIPPRQNRLPIRIEAGEKMYNGHEGGA
jgi:uncharacterized protein (DUF1684 family)